MLLRKKGNYLIYLEVGGYIPKSRNIKEMFSKKPNLFNILCFLREKGSLAKGVLVDIFTSNLTLSEIWEIRAELKRLKDQGVKVIGFLREGGIPELFLASGCSKVFVQSASRFILIGFSATINAFGGFFKKLNIELEAIKSGKLKAIPDILTKDTIPPELEQDAKRLIEELKRVLYDETQKFSGDLYFSGIVDSKTLVMNGGGDAVTDKTVIDIVKGEFGAVDIIYPQRKIQLIKIPAKKKIAILNMIGIVGENPYPNFISSSVFSGILKELTNDPRVDSVVVKVDSRGGDAGVAEVLSEGIKILSEKKNVYAFISSIGASGGYLIPIFANKIFATPFSAVGSIGVFLIKPNVSRLANKLGIKTHHISEGKFSNIFSPFKKLTPAEREILQKFTEDEHEEFIKKVAEGRAMPLEQVRKIADGSVFTGKRAKDLKLIDKIGSVLDVVELASDRKNLPIEEYPKIGFSEIFKIGAFEGSELINYFRTIDSCKVLSFFPLYIDRIF